MKNIPTFEEFINESKLSEKDIDKLMSKLGFTKSDSDQFDDDQDKKGFKNIDYISIQPSNATISIVGKKLPKNDRKYFITSSGEIKAWASVKEEVSDIDEAKGDANRNLLKIKGVFNVINTGDGIEVLVDTELDSEKTAKEIKKMMSKDGHTFDTEQTDVEYDDSKSGYANIYYFNESEEVNEVKLNDKEVNKALRSELDGEFKFEIEDGDVSVEVYRGDYEDAPEEIELKKGKLVLVDKSDGGAAFTLGYSFTKESEEVNEALTKFDKGDNSIIITGVDKTYGKRIAEYLLHEILSSKHLSVFDDRKITINIKIEDK